MTPSITAGLALVLIASTWSPAGRARPVLEADARQATSWMAEFPPYEIGLVYALRRGLASRRADRLLRADPTAVETVGALVDAGRHDQALRTARDVFERHPGRIAPVLIQLARILPSRDEVPGRAERLRDLLAQAESCLAVLERDSRAEAAYALVRARSSLLRGGEWSSSRTHRAALRAIVEDYAGTPAALEAEVELAEGAFYESRADAVRQHEAMLAFARAHRGTVAGARALYHAASHVASHADWLNLAPVGGGGDPTDRFLALLDIVSELQGGQYPTCEWTKRADSLVTGFYTHQPKYAPGSVDRMIAASERFVEEHWALDDEYPDGNGIGYLVTARMADLYGLKGERVAGVERLLGRLEEKVATDRFAVRYLRALFCMKVSDAGKDGPNPELLAKARQALTSIHEEGEGLYRRRALAALGSLAFYHRDYPTARDAFAKYGRLFPDSPYAWVAAMRRAQSYDRAGDWAAALAAYDAVPAGGDAAPFPRVLADVFAGRAYEAQGDPLSALARFRRAVDSWDLAFGLTYAGGAAQLLPPGWRMPATPRELQPESRAEKFALEARVAQLARTTAAPGGVTLERARWLLARERWTDAAKSADEVLARFPASPNAAEARYLGHRAQVEEALQRADVEQPGADATAALALLDRVGREPFDFAVCAGAIARAYLASGGGSAAEGKTRLLEALARWRDSQAPGRTATDLEKDAASIRTLVFRPNGDGLFAGTQWNGFAWPRQPAPFVVTPLEIPVTLADRTRLRLSFVQRFADLDNVLFVNEDQVGLLNALMTRLGGTRSREGRMFPDRGYMEAPNQPIGPSLSVMAFLQQGFPVMPGHWGGWHFVTFPVITELVFADAARTRALVHLRIGYGGGDAEVEKKDGTWVLTKVTPTWVE